MSCMLRLSFSLFLALLSLILCFSLGQTLSDFEPANAVITFGLMLKE